MMRTIFAGGVAGLVLLTVPGASQAAPIAPLPAAVMADLNSVTQVSWQRCWRDRWGRRICRRCWRDRWGNVRCR